MILYLDTSALVKRYFQEPFSEAVSEKWRTAEVIVTSSVAYAETMATIFRKRNESGIDNETIQKIIHAFRQDWGSLIRVEVTDSLNKHIDHVIRKYPLRGFDAIHLSSALLIIEKLPQKFFFACFDMRLNQAAFQENMETFEI